MVNRDLFCCLAIGLWPLQRCATGIAQAALDCSLIAGLPLSS